MNDSRDPRLSIDLASPADPARVDPSMYDSAEAFALPTSRSPRHAKEYLRVIYRRRRIMAAVFLLTLVSTVVYTYTRVPIYEAKVKLLIESTEPQYVGFEKVVESGSSGSDYYQTQYDLLKSRSLARRTLEASNLWGRFGVPQGAGDQAAATAPKQGMFTKIRSLLGSIKRSVLAPAEPEGVPADPAETVAQSRAVNGLIGGLVVVPIRNSRTVDLKYRSPDPAFATTVVNAHAKSFIEQNMEFKFTASKEASDWLAERLSEQRKQVEDASTALQRYREENDAIVAADDGENIVIQKLGDLSREVTRAKTLRLEKEAIYNQLRAIEKDSPALDTYPAVLSNPIVQQQQAELSQLQRRRLELSQTYLDTHPEMEALIKQINAVQARLRGEVAKVVQGVRNEYLAAVAQEQSLTQAMNDQKREALAMNRTAIEYGVLNREVESTRSVYQALLQRAQETGVSGEQRTSNVRIIDLAERPSSPVYPDRSGNLRTGLLTGLVLALFMGFFFEYFDNRIRTPDEIKTHLKLPSLGLLPLEATPVGDTRPGGEHSSPRFAESLRTLRTNIIFSTGESSCRSLLVTSTGPGEGKTVVSSNLAASLAEAGLRVLAIDADMRKPKLHAAFGVAQEPGLSNLIVGTVKASEVVMKTSTPGLWFVPAGRIPPNPAELLGSPRFREFLSSLRDHFDWVIIDTPPVMAVTDASVIAHRVSGVVFVVGSEMISRHHAVVALEQLNRAHAKLLGAVLNRVDIDRNAHYYSPYYRKEYVDYYQKARVRTAGVVDKV